ncbi:TBC-domain-containing protein [Meira miltonrushii]|uniref:TBC-domain-containing protein n=1 Tax=Meira miltonrushii TaxID=1280837 RepID=A0A316V2F7_9BASI|nr:TBC-domain-containing protein [Meira miltonrushii]PWN31737.1 TBC-domain-containing protein [Meira miltonrushii]
MTSDSEKHSPAHSDDDQAFQDAADGSGNEQEVNKHVSTSSQSTLGEKKAEDEAESQSTVDSKTSRIASSVKSLMSRFEGGGNQKPESVDIPKGKATKSTSSSIDENEGYQTLNQNEDTADGSTEDSIAYTHDSNEDSKGHADHTGESTISTENFSKDSGHATSEGSDSTQMAPSEGAPSLLDPTETISNPFSIPLTPDGRDDSVENAPATPRAALKRFSASTIEEESTGGTVDVPEHNISYVNPNRFSSVSLSTTQPYSSKRNTINLGQTEIPITPGEQATGSSEFLARNTARLSVHEGQRNSMNNTEKLKEKLNELRNAHEREHSAGRTQNGHDHAREVQQDGLQEEPLFEYENEDAKDYNTNIEGPVDYETSEEGIDWDFWGDVMSNYQDIARTQPRKLSKAIQAGIPAALRGMMWQLMSSSKDEEMEIIYAYYLKQTSPHEKMIRKDLARTFPGQVYFQDGKGIGQENLFNVVKAYSLYDEECGYCQGMQFVVGPLLLNMPDEEAFSTLVRLMKSYDLRGHFVPNMPSLQLRLFQFERLLEECLPLLHRHLVRQGVKSSMYASGWIMTLFTYRSPLPICFRILDSVFAEGIEAIFRFALALMKKNEDQLLQMSFDEAVPLLAARIFDIYRKDPLQDTEEDGTHTPDANASPDGNGEPHSSTESSQDEYKVGEFVRDAFQFKITPFMLDSYASDFAEQVRAATAHRREIETLKVENRSLQIRVKSLEDQLGAVQQEHVDLVKNVVMSKLAKEEMAEELMRYKMMYAEAALLVDQTNATSHSQPISPSPSLTASIRQSQG